MKTTVFFVAALFCVPAFADSSAPQCTSSQIHSNVTGTTEHPDLLSMGPDPGGHTGATVTPETTKTGQPVVDTARESASGGKTEKSGPSVNNSSQSKKN